MNCDCYYNHVRTWSPQLTQTPEWCFLFLFLATPLLAGLIILSIIHILSTHLEQLNFSVENHSSVTRKTTGLMNSALWLGHWEKRLLTCLCKTDRQQTSDIQQWLTWQTGNQSSRYLFIYFVWMEFIWFYVWSTCPCTVIYCNGWPQTSSCS